MGLPPCKQLQKPGISRTTSAQAGYGRADRALPASPARSQGEQEGNFRYFTGIGVDGETGTAVTAFIGLPSMSLSE